MKKLTLILSLLTLSIAVNAFAGRGAVVVGTRGGVAVAGNNGHYRGAVVIAPRPAYYAPVYYAPVPAYHGYPPVPQQVIPVAPYQGAVWISGYWVHERGIYTWRSGHWR